MIDEGEGEAVHWNKWSMWQRRESTTTDDRNQRTNVNPFLSRYLKEGGEKWREAKKL